jgi:hypothetical protein
MGYSGAQGKLIHEKNLSRKYLVRLPLKEKKVDQRQNEALKKSNHFEERTSSLAIVLVPSHERLAA